MELLSEVVMVRINIFLQHYNTLLTLGAKLTISLQCLQLEIESDQCPLMEPFVKLGALVVVPCWCKLFQESLDHYKFDFYLNYPIIPHPQEGNKLLNNIFLSSNL